MATKPIKQKLNLTISSDARRKARRLARKQRRSLSTLFEHLIDKEYEKTAARQRRPLRNVIEHGLAIAAGVSVLFAAQAQFPSPGCKHFCLPQSFPLHDTLPQS